jgi:hypothetical protein
MYESIKPLVLECFFDEKLENSTINKIHFIKNQNWEEAQKSINLNELE